MPKGYRIELVKGRVAPADRTWEEGIVTDGATTTPFIVERSWSGPAGHYQEHWTIRASDGTILHEGKRRTLFIRGMQSASTFTDVVTLPVKIDPGTYDLVFTVEGRYMASAPIVVRQAAAA